LVWHVILLFGEAMKSVRGARFTRGDGTRECHRPHLSAKIPQILCSRFRWFHLRAGRHLASFRGRLSPAAMMMRVSTPRRFSPSGMSWDSLRIPLVRTPARERGTSIPRVTAMPSLRSSTLLMISTNDAVASASSCEGQQDVERKSAHRGRGVELLCDSDE